MGAMNDSYKTSGRDRLGGVLCMEGLALVLPLTVIVMLAICRAILFGSFALLGLQDGVNLRHTFRPGETL